MHSSEPTPRKRLAGVMGAGDVTGAGEEAPLRRLHQSCLSGIWWGSG